MSEITNFERMQIFGEGRVSASINKAAEVIIVARQSISKISYPYLKYRKTSSVKL